MTKPKAMTIGIIALATLLFSSCSDDSGDSADDTTTTVEDTATTAPGDEGSTIPPEDSEPPLDFDEALADTRASIEAAGDDPCALTEALSGGSGLGQPTTLEEAVATLSLAEDVYLRLADLAPGDLTAEKATIKDTFAAMIDEANSSTASMEEYLSTGPQGATDPDFNAALEAVQTGATATCTDGIAGDI